MAEAIKTISVARGYDVTRYALNCFGGAGGQHACDVADALAITTVLIHPFSSLLSAYGMGLADIAAQRGQGVEEPLSQDALARVGAIADQLADAAVAEVMSQGVAREAIKVHRRAQLRYAGSDTTIEVELSTSAAMRRAFERRAQKPLRLHRSRQGDRDRGGVGRGDRRRRAPRRAEPPRDLRRAARPGPRDAFLLPRRLARGECLFARGAAGRRQRRWAGAGHRAASDDRRRTGLARRDHGEEPCAPDPRRADAAARGDRRQGRSGHARDLQPSLHVDRRADGRDAAEHRLFGQHQGAARLFLRGFRPPGPPGRQRAAYAGPSRLDGPLGRDDHPRQCRPHPPGRRVRAQRAL